MGELINGRTPEEIKQELQWLIHGCPESEPECEDCIHSKICSNATEAEAPRRALALIERLESERDAAMAKVPRWISVEERLPEESGYYLYLCDSPIRGLQNGVGVSYFQHKAKLWKKVYNPCVTHWMPLPESKKEYA